jgi:hypothetical protein
MGSWGEISHRCHISFSQHFGAKNRNDAPGYTEKKKDLSSVGLSPGKLPVRSLQDSLCRGVLCSVKLLLRSDSISCRHFQGKEILRPWIPHITTQHFIIPLLTPEMLEDLNLYANSSWTLSQKLLYSV